MEENYLKLLEYEQKLEKTGEYLSREKEKELVNYQSQISVDCVNACNKVFLN